ncbi:Ni/Co efflux regulator RcnB [Sphingomonas sp. BE123]|jgi:Ni/Co efflux regulator RcnB|uniref:RcnB family protein n=1 Tax=Sphingomonas sp. BE123 TaxID=2817842 RepID=UPI00285D3463|nr:RcnB family protein [Sphingomonas sp. BE123]MDR6851395.1 Ni/Co efflux regulator RcnB [Sphingomonas sp. BE123]
MRTLTLATLSIAAIAVATPAQAQRVWRDGQWVQRDREPVRYPPRSVPATRIDPPRAPDAGGRWGPMIGGRWHAGTRAPGGWSAYRRPVRGWTLPGYWVSGGFWIDDWSAWGLSRPPHGYGWLRYYDDAVLADRDGRVWDSVSGLDWSRAGGGGGGSATAYAGSGGAAAAAAGGGGGSYGARYAAPGYDDDYADDRHARRPIPAQPYPGGYAPPPCASPCGAQGGGYARGYHGGSSGYYMAGPTVTTIVIQSGAVTTTTVTEEVIEEVEEVRTYRAPVKTVRRYPSKTVVRRSTKECCR